MQRLDCVFSPAKLNLFLHITGKLPNGYHALQTVFVALDFGDWLTFFANGSPNSPLITLTGADGLTKNVDDNLIIKAGNLLADFAKTRGKGERIFPIQIALEKHIPTGAGLGGGSSNAGTTLLTLNRLWGLNLDTQTLIELATQLGADVPFFIVAPHSPYAIGEGIGERLTPITLPASRFLILCPAVHSATAQVFANPALNKSMPTLTHSEILAEQGDFLGKLNAPFCNVFEPIATQNAKIFDALAYLNGLATHTQTTPRLTGTGSAVFLPVQGVADEVLGEWVDNAPCRAVVANGGISSPILSQNHGV